MHWILKSAAFKVLSLTPGGQAIYHSAQRRFTGTTQLTPARLTGKIEQTLRYWAWLEANSPPGWLRNASHLDLGAGWFPNIPMTFYALGLDRQYLVDVTPHMTPAAVIETARVFNAVAPLLQKKFPRVPPIPAGGQALETALKPLGMVYAAPYEGLAGEIAGTVGFVTATSMLFHMPRAILRQVFHNLHSLLVPGGYFLGQHYLRQLIDGLNSRTSPFFALRYSDSFWDNFTGSPMMYYNRLKTRDYRGLLEEAGFEMAHIEVDPGSPEDYALLDRAKIHPMFAGYSRDELAAKYLFFAARKPK